MQTYNVQINEEQRAIIEAALRAQFPDFTADDEGALLLSMFMHLPDDEAQEPGITHGFAY